MYLNIIILPLLSLFIIGLLGRYLGIQGLLRILILNLTLVIILVILMIYENYLDNIILKIDICNNIKTDIFNINYYIYFDDLSQLMLLIITSITFIVIIYTYDYLISDAHIVRFYFYIILFVFFMIILITTNSLPILFIGWEGVGLSSFLLISFWYTRFQAQLGALLALIMNRMGDMSYILGIILSLYLLGSLDIISINSNYYYLNWDYLLLTFFIAAMAKSAQIYLHLWLPYSMEGQNRKYSSERDHKGKYIKGNNAVNNSRDEKITQYQKEAIIGLLLSDVSIRGKVISFTFKSGHLDFTRWLKFEILDSMCSKLEPNSYPKLNPTQYTFSTLSFNYLENLRIKWYPILDALLIPIKTIPNDLYKYFTEISLAFMIMGDGYWENSSKTIIICTECFSLQDIHILLYILRVKFGLVVSTKKRGNGYRLRFSSKEKNIRLLRSLIVSHFHPSMHYKLGL